MEIDPFKNQGCKQEMAKTGGIFRQKENEPRPPFYDSCYMFLNKLCLSYSDKFRKKNTDLFNLVYNDWRFH